MVWKAGMILQWPVDCEGVATDPSCRALAAGVLHSLAHGGTNRPRSPRPSGQLLSHEVGFVNPHSGDQVLDPRFLL
jgi:hypothetical protein